MVFNLVYFGSPSFSADILKSLITNPIGNIKVVAVVTNPDRPTGRHQLLTPSPVAQLAQQHHLPVFRPDKLDSSNLAHLKLLNPHLFLIAAYGKIIPPDWLDLPQIAPLNLHFSLLPQYRGALCIHQAIKNQDRHTGVTLMEVDPELDHGPIIAQVKQSISISDDTASLTKKLTRKAIQLTKVVLPAYLNWHQHKKTTPNTPGIKIYLPPKNQDHTQASYTPPTSSLNHANAHIPWSNLQKAINGHQSAATHALIRSLNPQPGAWTDIDQQPLKILSTTLNQDHLRIDKVQLPGKNPITWTQFLSGHPLKI